MGFGIFQWNKLYDKLNFFIIDFNLLIQIYIFATLMRWCCAKLFDEVSKADPTFTSIYKISDKILHFSLFQTYFEASITVKCVRIFQLSSYRKDVEGNWRNLFEEIKIFWVRQMLRCFSFVPSKLRQNRERRP